MLELRLASKPAPADEAALLARDGAIVANDRETERLVRVRHGVLLLGESEEQDITSAGGGEKWGSATAGTTCSVNASEDDHLRDKCAREGGAGTWAAARRTHYRMTTARVPFLFPIRSMALRI